MTTVLEIHEACPPLPELAKRLGLAMAKRPRLAAHVVVLCPWHRERTPSCSIVRRGGRVLAHCHGCQAGGDLLEIVAAVRGLDTRRDFRRVLQLAAELVGVAWQAEPRRRQPRRRPEPAAMVADALERLAEQVILGRPDTGRAERELWRWVMVRLTRSRDAEVVGVLCEALRDLAALDRMAAGRDPLEDEVDRLEASGELRRRELELEGLGGHFVERDLARLEIALALQSMGTQTA